MPNLRRGRIYNSAVTTAQQNTKVFKIFLCDFYRRKWRKQKAARVDKHIPTFSLQFSQKKEKKKNFFIKFGKLIFHPEASYVLPTTMQVYNIKKWIKVYDKIKLIISSVYYSAEIVITITIWEIAKPNESTIYQKFINPTFTRAE